MIFEKCMELFEIHAKKETPYEACAVISGGKLILTRNISTSPCDSFEIDPQELIYVESNFGPIQSILHSHHSTNFPSKLDMQRQQHMGIPWGIVYIEEGRVRDSFFFGDQVPTVPYVGRHFRWGVHDCWTLARDWYKNEMGIRMPNPPRDRDCFERGEDFYCDFAKWGFVKIPKLEKIGDGMIFRLSSVVPNHCGILVEGEQILHQPLTSMSRRGPVHLWMNKAIGFFRHKDYM